MKSVAQILILSISLYMTACSGDPSPEDPIDQEDLDQEDLEQEDLDQEDFNQENNIDSENINSDIDNEFVDNQAFGNEDILTQNNAVNFEDGDFQNNAFFQNEGEGQFQEQGNMFNNGNQFLNQQGQQPLDQGQQQLFGQNQQMFGNQGDQFSQNQQMFQDSGEGVNNAMDGQEFLQDQQTNFQQAAVDTSVGDVSGGGRVKYVTANGSNLYDQPNGTSAASLEKGDHPLVFDEGEWARTSDGYYIPNRDLTNSPVSRIRRKTGWSY